MEIVWSILWGVVAGVIGVLIPIIIKRIVLYRQYYTMVPHIKLIVCNMMTYAEEKYIKAFKKYHHWNLKSQKYVYDYIIEQTKIHMSDEMIVVVKNYIRLESLEDWIFEIILQEIEGNEERKEKWKVSKQGEGEEKDENI